MVYIEIHVPLEELWGRSINLGWGGVGDNMLNLGN
jgi:hypothetical protein